MRTLLEEALPLSFAVVGFAAIGLVVLLTGDGTAPAAATPEHDAPAEAQSAEDPYLWLEEVTGQKALDWVRQQNALSTKELEASPVFEPIRSRVLSILDSKER